MTIKENVILNHFEIQDKIKRIAYQIYECNAEESEVILAGIDKNGYILAEKLLQTLKNISDLKAILCKVIVDKQSPRNEVKTSLSKEEYTNKSIVLIDDVLNSGETLIYGVKHFLEVPLKQFKTAVLVNRNHKKYPVKADFKGISLSTSLHEHIEIDLTNKLHQALLK